MGRTSRIRTSCVFPSVIWIKEGIEPLERFFIFLDQTLLVCQLFHSQANSE
jgi:hypothetical protein